MVYLIIITPRKHCVGLKRMIMYEAKSRQWLFRTSLKMIFPLKMVF